MTREEAIKKLQKQKDRYLEEWVDYGGVAEAFDMAIKALEELPKRRKEAKRWKHKALQAEPKHGKWRYFVNGGLGLFKDDSKRCMWALCSECGVVSAVGGNYCPNCGAKMDKEEEA